MRYLILKNRKVIDLEDKGISSWEYIDEKRAKSDEFDWEEAFYMIYYFDENKGDHLEQDGKGGRSMDNYDESFVLATCDTPEELLNYETVSITRAEYERLKKLEADYESATAFKKRFAQVFAKSGFEPEAWYKIENGEWQDIKIVVSNDLVDLRRTNVAIIMKLDLLDRRD